MRCFHFVCWPSSVRFEGFSPSLSFSLCLPLSLSLALSSSLFLSAWLSVCFSNRLIHGLQASRLCKARLSKASQEQEQAAGGGRQEAGGGGRCHWSVTAWLASDCDFAFALFSFSAVVVVVGYTSQRRGLRCQDLSLPLFMGAHFKTHQMWAQGWTGMRGQRRVYSQASPTKMLNLINASQ